MSTPSSKPLVKAPESFDGSKARYKNFLMQLLQYIGDPAISGESDTRKISIALSYIRGPNVEAWLDNYFTTNWDRTANAWRTAWTDFVNSLDARFKDSNAERIAQEKLENFKQGRLTADDFFQQFEQLVYQAAMTTTDKHVISLLQKNVNSDIVKLIFNRDTLPADYQEWKKLVTRHDANQRLLALGNSHRTYDSQLKPASRPMQALAPASFNPTPSTSVTYGGQGQAMDINRSRQNGLICYNCRQKGHISRNCPNKKTTIRNMALSDEDRAELAKEWGFHQVQQ